VSDDYIRLVPRIRTGSLSPKLSRCFPNAGVMRIRTRSRFVSSVRGRTASARCRRPPDYRPRVRRSAKGLLEHRVGRSSGSIDPARLELKLRHVVQLRHGAAMMSPVETRTTYSSLQMRDTRGMVGQYTELDDYVRSLCDHGRNGSLCRVGCRLGAGAPSPASLRRTRSDTRSARSFLRAIGLGVHRALGRGWIRMPSKRSCGYP
jgi:hypothetical protein